MSTLSSPAPVGFVTPTPAFGQPPTIPVSSTHTPTLVLAPTDPIASNSLAVDPNDTTSLSDEPPKDLKIKDSEDPKVEDLEDLLEDAHISNSIYPSDLRPTYSSEDLTPRKIERDPILSRLAKSQCKPKSQSQVQTSSHEAVVGSTFKARPVPLPREGNVGPRMTKTAALRQGKNWDEIKASEKAATASATDKKEAKVVNPAAKRIIAIPASLSAPTLAPRQNRAALLRAGITPTKSILRDPTEIAAINKARADAEKEKRRQSVVLPASLAAPSIVPRANKASSLRTGSAFPPSTSSGSLADVAKSNVEEGPKIERRRSVAVASLSQPSITPRSNKTSALRTNSIPRSESSHSALTLSSAANRVGDREKGKAMTTHERALMDKAERLARRSSVAGPLRSLAAPSIAPRLNRAAMLRAPGLGQSDSSSSSLAQIGTGTNSGSGTVRSANSGLSGHSGKSDDNALRGRTKPPPPPSAFSARSALTSTSAGTDAEAAT